ncbi:MAG: CoA transferase, partial [Pseudonocardiaceae bacterium]
VWTPLHRPLATADGWVALCAHTRMEPDRVAAACGAGPSFEAIAARVRQQPSRIWVERLSGAGLAGVPVCTSLAALATDPRFAPALQHDICTFTRPPWEFS